MENNSRPETTCSLGDTLKKLTKKIAGWSLAILSKKWQKHNVNKLIFKNVMVKDISKSFTHDKHEKMKSSFYDIFYKNAGSMEINPQIAKTVIDSIRKEMKKPNNKDTKENFPLLISI